MNVNELERVSLAAQFIFGKSSKEIQIKSVYAEKTILFEAECDNKEIKIIVKNLEEK